jgi:eukaryotic-like serine/threonine-protein kinase
LPNSSGTRFGRYELLEQIGAGGMGEVFRARDHDLHRDVAIKLLPEQFASDPDRLARFEQEARTASSLNHPNIVTIHEIGRKDGRPYIVMEYVDGETLRHVLHRGRLLPVKQTLDIGAQLADGLAKAHAARIVHRDLKPENVMITKDGFAKILDFGLAKLRARPEEGLGATSPRSSEAKTELSPNTAVGVLLGTAGYMAPEQVRGLPADHRSDQFALGAMIYELATGHRAFERKSVVQTLSAILDDEPRPIAELNPAFPPPARWPIERCLAKEPDARYASTLDLAHELRGIRDRLGEAISSAPVLEPVVRGGLRPRRLHVALVIVAMLAAVFLFPVVKGAWRDWRRPPPLTGEVRLAVLFDDSRLPTPDRERLAGLLDYVVIRLADLNRFRSSFSVVPASELRETMVRAPGDARRRVGATLAVSLAMHRADRDLVVSASLEGTESPRVLGGDQKSFPADHFSAEDAVDLIVDVLRIELQSKERSEWIGGTSGIAEARSLFAKGLTQTPYQIAQTALERHDQEKSLQTAIDYFNRAIELDPRYADAYARLGEAYLLLYRLTKRPEDITLAAQNAAKARDLDDTRPSSWVTLGMIDAQRGAYADGERSFRKAIDRGPRTSAAYRELGRLQLRQGQYDLAETSYRKAIELDPESWSNHNALGGFLSNVRRYGEAEQAFLAATSKAPDNARVWSNLGALYYLQGKYDDAEKTLERAIALYEYGPALSNLATIKYRVRRDYTRAARILERAVKASPRDYRIWKNLAGAYRWAPGERERAADAERRAIAIIEEARRVEPDDPELIADLSDGLAFLGDTQQARQLIGHALTLAPANGVVARVAVSVYEKLGERNTALRHVAVALKAGMAPFEFESSPALAELVKDTRYVALTKESASQVNRR